MGSSRLAMALSVWGLLGSLVSSLHSLLFPPLAFLLLSVSSSSFSAATLAACLFVFRCLMCSLDKFILQHMIWDSGVGGMFSRCGEVGGVIVVGTHLDPKP